MSEAERPKPEAPEKPRAAASLTADVVARGRRRTQEYGEAGLWRGRLAPVPSEAPLRVALPPAPGDVARAAEVADAPEALPVAATAAVPEESGSGSETPAGGEPADDLGPLLILCVACFFAVFVAVLLYF